MDKDMDMDMGMDIGILCQTVESTVKSAVQCAAKFVTVFSRLTAHPPCQVNTVCITIQGVLITHNGFTVN
jgi:hypothetical protein